MRDLNAFVKRSGSAIGGATGQPAPRPLSAGDIDKITKIVKNPSFDVYVGKDDEVIRRVSGRVELTVPKRDRPAADGIEGGSLEFSVEFRNVNGRQRIEAPAKARPLSALTRSLGGGGLGALGGVGGDDTGGGSSQQPPTTTAPDAEAFKEYADCLEKSRPNDTKALQRCADLLAPAGGIHAGSASADLLAPAGVIR